VLKEAWCIFFLQSQAHMGKTRGASLSAKKSSMGVRDRNFAEENLSASFGVEKSSAKK
jgi:hypothetical protein